MVFRANVSLGTHGHCGEEEVRLPVTQSPGCAALMGTWDRGQGSSRL